MFFDAENRISIKKLTVFESILTRFGLDIHVSLCRILNYKNVFLFECNLPFLMFYIF